MKLVEVHNRKEADDFIKLPWDIYKNDPSWICPLELEVRNIFRPETNSYFSHGTCTRWVLYDARGKAIGRIAAFINFKKVDAGHRLGGVGFFECVNNQMAANLLLDTAKTWLQQKGLEGMEGPINFGENDKYWGLLVEGFKPPSMGMNYNPPYYQQLLEHYGFVKAYDQLTNFLDATRPLPERFTRIADWIRKKPGYSFRHFEVKHFDKFAADFREIYNDAWQDFENFVPIDMDSIRDSFRQMKPVMDEKIIWFAYYKEEPIAFVLCLPDVNQVLRHVNGKLDLWGKLKFLWYKKTMTIDRLRIIIMGCKQKYQNHGVESALIQCLQHEVVPRGTIKGVELAWVGDFNEKMMSIHEATGATRDKVHRTYRYMFD
jgi:hypothetical protein